ncbi:hypothetical protein BOTBODRAFT_443953 [Botryobasidium botryosum FD-172 SS1]|uniref:Uncharacterized protein n=1 Tax=Botryobasidium botryosum (strain FD-172 SS1) TaxID=930990 RepID=A0A067MV29_BOTB1|nr:hypothetical protein BOTBODRAFT_443953 [Botryobasidium botryosum FD-172 SS1]
MHVSILRNGNVRCEETLLGGCAILTSFACPTQSLCPPTSASSPANIEATQTGGPLFPLKLVSHAAVTTSSTHVRQWLVDDEDVPKYFRCVATGSLALHHEARHRPAFRSLLSAPFILYIDDAEEPAVNKMNK